MAQLHDSSLGNSNSEASDGWCGIKLKRFQLGNRLTHRCDAQPIFQIPPTKAACHGCVAGRHASGAAADGAPSPRPALTIRFTRSTSIKAHKIKAIKNLKVVFESALLRKLTPTARRFNVVKMVRTEGEFKWKAISKRYNVVLATPANRQEIFLA